METLIQTPLQLYLYQRQFDALQKLADEQGVAVEDLALQAIEALLTQIESDAAERPEDEELTDEELANDPLRAIIGLGRSGVTDLAENHDKYLMEFEIESNRRWLQKSS